MASKKWKPDPKIIRKLEKSAKVLARFKKLTFGKDELSLEEVIEEVKKGTPFGRSFYRAYKDALKITKRR